jgi:type I restriction enzyme M protein
MSYWNTTLQDDLFLVANYGWVEAALPREIKKIKDKNKKEVWPDAVPDYLDGKRRFRSELISRALLVDKYFAEEQLNLSGLEASVAKLEVELETIKEEHAGDEGFLIEFAEIDGEKIKFDKKSLVRWIKDNENTPERSEELSAANQILVLMDAISSAKSSVKQSSELLSNRIAEKFGALQEAEVIELVVDSKWKKELQKALSVQLRNLISRLDGRLRELSTRYSSPLSQIEESLVQLSELVRSEIEELRGK